MSLHRTSLAAVAFAFGLLVSAYCYVCTFVATAHASVSVAEDCPRVDQSQSTENPNKMLFISCGGFLE